MWYRILCGAVVIAVAVSGAVTAWIAYPTNIDLKLKPPLISWSPSAGTPDTYARDFKALASAFTPQKYRSFCGPASISTVLRAFGESHVDQADLLPTIGDKLDVFYTGMSLADLRDLAQSVGLKSELVYANELSLETFRERLKSNLQREGDFVLINYDRQVLRQSGAGHISPVGAYDPGRDAFLVLDEASFKYPFTWVPAALLYQASHTRADQHYRGVLFIHGYETASTTHPVNRGKKLQNIPPSSAG
jgi:hypothetical protein